MKIPVVILIHLSVSAFGQLWSAAYVRGKEVRSDVLTCLSLGLCVQVNGGVKERERLKAKDGSSISWVVGGDVRPLWVHTY